MIVVDLAIALIILVGLVVVVVYFLAAPSNGEKKNRKATPVKYSYRLEDVVNSENKTCVQWSIYKNNTAWSRVDKPIRLTDTNYENLVEASRVVAETAVDRLNQSIIKNEVYGK